MVLCLEKIYLVIYIMNEQFFDSACLMMIYREWLIKNKINSLKELFMKIVFFPYK